MALKNSTAGSKWGDMAAPVMTAEVRRELKIIRLRQYANPKRFYKALDNKGKAPKFFHLGNVEDSAYQGRSSRVTRRNRKGDFIEELKHDTTFRSYAKRTYNAIQEEHMEGRGRRGGKNKKSKNKRF